MTESLSRRPDVYREIIRTGNADSIRLIQEVASDMVIAYRLWQASKQYAGGQVEVDMLQQFLNLKTTLEILARFHLTRKIHVGDKVY